MGRRNNQRWRQMKKIIHNILQMLSSNISPSNLQDSTAQNYHPLRNLYSLDLAQHLKPMLQESISQQNARQRQTSQRLSFQHSCNTHCQPSLHQQDTNPQSLNFSQSQPNSVNESKNKYYFIERQNMKKLVAQFDNIYRTKNQFNIWLNEITKLEIQDLKRPTLNYATIFEIVDQNQEKQVLKSKLKLQAQRQLDQYWTSQYREPQRFQELRFDGLMTNLCHQITKLEVCLKNSIKALNCSLPFQMNSLEKHSFSTQQAERMLSLSHIHSHRNQAQNQAYNYLQQMPIYRQQAVPQSMENREQVNQMDQFIQSSFGNQRNHDSFSQEQR